MKSMVVTHENVEKGHMCCAKHPHTDEMGDILYGTSQCPYHAKDVPVIAETAKEKAARVKAVHFWGKGEPQDAPTPITVSDRNDAAQRRNGMKINHS